VSTGNTVERVFLGIGEVCINPGTSLYRELKIKKILGLREDDVMGYCINSCN
jgi:hypothetical protein